MFHGRAACIRVDHDRPLGTLNVDEPLTADQALAEQTRLPCTDSCVPWDEWRGILWSWGFCGRGDSVVVGILIGESKPEILVHGVQAVAVWSYFAGDRDVQT